MFIVFYLLKKFSELPGLTICFFSPLVLVAPLEDAPPEADTSQDTWHLPSGGRGRIQHCPLASKQNPNPFQQHREFPNGLPSKHCSSPKLLSLRVQMGSGVFVTAPPPARPNKKFQTSEDIWPSKKCSKGTSGLNQQMQKPEGELSPSATVRLWTNNEWISLSVWIRGLECQIKCGRRNVNILAAEISIWTQR